jgi:hypothetical protein
MQDNVNNPKQPVTAQLYPIANLRRANKLIVTLITTDPKAVAKHNAARGIVDLEARQRAKKRPPGYHPGWDFIGRSADRSPKRWVKRERRSRPTYA